ncbi:MAG: MoaD/ThiS family protein [Candidatus Odinarchaeum yellowstonii]|uniref:MoaD/ThiS family protein n=1 Tax=Odinarchaeota yellowstonii (strain LCB_4) TaxID=1841599 RepID=A0AAF0D3P7_ODILC|nr:MAG: MoaD/ThiS family protein [Candidatus Odinarchaeum yellowstonii]
MGESEVAVELPGARYKLQQLLDLITSTRLKKARKILLEQINKGRIKIVINGRLVNSAQLNEFQLEDGDRIVFLPPFGGG